MSAVALRGLLFLTLTSLVVGCLGGGGGLALTLEPTATVFRVGEVPTGEVVLRNGGTGPVAIVRIDAVDFPKDVRDPSGDTRYGARPPIVPANKYQEMDRVTLNPGQSLTWRLSEVVSGYVFDQGGTWSVTLYYTDAIFANVPGITWHGTVAANATLAYSLTS